MQKVDMVEKLDLSVIVLCPERNIGGLRGTVGSIKRHFYDRDIVCITGNNATADELKEMKAYCPSYKGKDTITSLMNTGMKKIKTEWGFIIYAGSCVRAFMERKLANFVTSTKDVLYPIVDMKLNFMEGSSNGILLSKELFKAAGEFPDAKMYKQGTNDFELAKMLWALSAIECGGKFKGIMGLRVI
jgi:hypothetical protein